MATDTQALKNARIAVLGYGSQGRAHALNLRDSGLDVVVGLRAGGPTSFKAQEDGLRVLDPAEAVKGADLVAVLTPDMVQPKLYTDVIAPNLKPNAAVLFAHGLQYPLQDDHAARRYRCDPGRPEGSWCPGTQGIRDRSRRTVSVCRASGRKRSCPCPRSSLRGGHRWRPRDVDRNRFQGRDRDRSVRRTGRALRRASANWCGMGSKHWSKPATNRRLPITK